jgi:hypothetical protein
MLIADWVSSSVFVLFGPGTDRLLAVSYHSTRSQLVWFNRGAYYNIFRAAGLPESPATLGASDAATVY